MTEILATGRTASEAWMDAVAQHHDVHRIGNETDAEPVLAAVGDRVRCLVSGGGFTVDAALMDRLPHLGMITVTGAGFDRIDMAAAKARGIGVCNAPDATAICVADMAMGLYLAVGRNIVAFDRFVRAGRWPSGSVPRTRRVSHRRAGIWGLGRIGQEIARRATGFSMDVHYSTRQPRPVPYTHHAGLADLAAAVDVLFCAVPATPQTVGAVDAAVLEALGPTGIVVNIARGSVIDEPALIAALANGTIAGAGLDVFADEPRVPEALMAMENVVLTPHSAGSTQETWNDVVTAVLANIDAYLTDGRYLNPVPA